MKIFGHERKPGKGGQIGVVQHVHMYVGNVDRKVSGEMVPHCKALSPLVYKRREGPLVKGLPILSVRGIPLRLRVSCRFSLRLISFRVSFIMYLDFGLRGRDCNLLAASMP